MTDTDDPTTWDELLREFKCKPNIKVEHRHDIDFDDHWLILEMRVPDVYNPERLTTVSTQRLVERFELLGEKAALYMIRLCIQDLEMHEIDEWIMYRGEKIYDPHREQVKV